MTTTPNEPVQDPQTPTEPEKPHGDPLTQPSEEEPGQMPDHDTEIGA